MPLQLQPFLFSFLFSFLLDFSESPAFVENIFDRPLVRARVLCIVILVESRKLHDIVARKAKRTVHVNAFIVDEMVEDLFDGPFSWRVAIQKEILGKGRDKVPSVLKVLGDVLQDQSIIGKKIDVDVCVSGILGVSGFLNDSEGSELLLSMAGPEARFFTSISNSAFDTMCPRF